MQQLHGSGKTAVLVERIINKIVNEKIDINTILIVTFTNAAASEMREKILEAIYKRLESNPFDSHLQKQITLINKASICTIHSFCLDIIKNNFFEINIAPNFRIGNQAEIELLKQEVIEDLFEEKYDKQNKDFLELIDIYTNYRGDDDLKEIILNIYKTIQSNPFPEDWLNEKVNMFNIENCLNEDFSNTIWGKIILDNYIEEITDCIVGLENVNIKLSKYNELKKYSDVILEDIDNLKTLILNIKSWDKAFELSNNIIFNKWPVDRKIVIEEKELAKDARDKIKKNFNIIRDKYLKYTSNQANKDIYDMYNILVKLKDIILEFSNKFSKYKLERNIIDFNDIEHFALKILVEKRDDTYTPTEIAKTYKDKFVEIAIDEYQDSNLVQEYILTTISNNNMFMVGDVKQSIYKFRQARPELFLEKYEKYETKQNNKSKGIKIKLFKNFRSSKNILDITNIIFKSIMSRKLGNIEYDEQEFLNLGINYEQSDGKDKYFEEKCSLYIIDKQEEIEQEDELNKIEDTVLEAKFVAKKVKELLDSEFKIYDKKLGYRPITYKDIVILLRTTVNIAPIYEKELLNLQLPVYSDIGLEYIDSIEVQTVMSLLKIIDNPMQDIPFVTVLRSQIGGFSDDDLVQIRINDKNSSFYEAMLKSQIQVEDSLKNKIITFLELIENFRTAKEYLTLDELIWRIYIDTGYFNFVGLMPNGNLRQANLKILFERAKEYENVSFKGLFNFITFIDKIKLNNNDLGSAKLIGENENVIRIMSIHKSKGLEFPVVFLSGIGKGFNMMDLNQTILIHQDIGMGPKYINYERKIEYNTLAREAIKVQYKIETLSEEMRLLYVALTRSKEKLIITGISKNVKQDMEKKERLLQIYENLSKNYKINTTLIKKYRTYLDWLELIYIYNKSYIKEILELNIYEKSNIIKEFNDITIDEEMNFEVKIQNELNNLQQNINISNLLDWNYKYNMLTKIPTKTSVSKINGLLNDEIIEFNTTPKFLKGSLGLDGSQKGTIMHLCMQQLDFSEEYTIDKLKGLINNMVERNMITQTEAESININKLYKFTKSEIWQDIKLAKEIHKEKPFYLNIPIKDIYDQQIDEKILVQGIIDLYYINKNGEIILLDYKTDYIKENEEQILVEKYNKQLQLYKRAIEGSTHNKVKGVYIYSISINKLIPVFT